MSKHEFGNNLLYLLSEKTSLKYSEFKKYIEYLYKDINNYTDHIPYSPILRGLNSLGYMDIGQNTQKGTTVVQVAPAMLVELPYLQHTFLLTGMRTPELLKIFKSSLCVKITSHKYLPDTVLVYPEDKLALKNWLKTTTAFQGNKLSSYIKVYDRPVAWDILDFTGDLKSYQSCLEWSSGGDLSNVTKVFDISSGVFKRFHSNRMTLPDGISLVEVSLYNNSYYKYFLFKKEDHKQVQIDKNWGRFVVAYKSEASVLKYDIKKFALSSVYPLPYLFERGLTLLSGCCPQKRKSPNDTVFKYVPEQIANLISDKLGQKLQII